MRLGQRCVRRGHIGWLVHPQVQDAGGDHHLLGRRQQVADRIEHGPTDVRESTVRCIRVPPTPPRPRLPHRHRRTATGNSTRRRLPDPCVDPFPRTDSLTLPSAHGIRSGRRRPRVLRASVRRGARPPRRRCALDDRRLHGPRGRRRGSADLPRDAGKPLRHHDDLRPLRGCRRRRRRSPWTPSRATPGPTARPPSPAATSTSSTAPRSPRSRRTPSRSTRNRPERSLRRGSPIRTPASSQAALRLWQ